MQLLTTDLRRALALPLLVVMLGACGDAGRERWEETGGEVARSWEPEPTETLSGFPRDTVRNALEQRIETGRPEGVAEHDWPHLRALYRAYGHLPLWLTENGVHPRTNELFNALEHAHTDALSLAEYPLDELEAALMPLGEEGDPSLDQLLEAELMLSAAYVALAEDMFEGQLDPRAMSQGWHVDAPEANVDSAIVLTIQMEPLDRAIARMRPQREDVDFLRRMLERYRGIVEQGGWPDVPDGDVLEPGDTTTIARLSVLRARLAVEEFVDGRVRIEPLRDSTGQETDRALYGGELAGGVAKFQAHHGIVVDSILGRGTLVSLNTSAEYRLRQIAANLERFRWLPRSLGDRYIFVNVPAFRAEAYDEGGRVLDMRVIVGAEYDDRSTPAFSDSMSYVVFRPYWNVPENIALNEVLPAAHRDPSYMQRNHYEVVRGWREDAPALGQYVPGADAIASGAVRIRQRPGDHNALGLVKFMFPNDFDIYLHHTPAEELFERDIRAFSHGCIRVEKPVELAQFVLGWDAERVRAAMESGPGAHQVNLERKIPVYILYLTAYLRDGALHFGNDLYHRDAALTKAVAKAATPDPETQAQVRRLRELVERVT